MPKNQIAKNITFLGLVQGTNYVVPLIAIPILIDRVGINNYGILALTQGTAAIFTTIVDFGFNITGTRLVSQNLSDKTYIGRVLSKIYASRFLLLIIAFLILVFLVTTIPIWNEHRPIFFSSYLIVIGQSFFPVWYFQGIQKMNAITLLNFLSRIFYLLALIFFVMGPESLMMVNIYNGIGWLLGSVIALPIMLRRLKLDYSISFQDIFEFVLSNLNIFLSQLWDSMYRNGGIVIAGFLFQENQLAIYGILDKIVLFIQRSFSILYRAIFPKVCNLVEIGIKEVKQFYANFIKILIGPMILGGGVIFLFGAELISYLSSEIQSDSFDGAVRLLAIFPILLLFNLPFSTYLVAANHHQLFVIYNLSAFILFGALGTLLGSLVQVEGLIMAILITEMCILFIAATGLKMKGYKF